MLQNKATARIDWGCSYEKSSKKIFVNSNAFVFCGEDSSQCQCFFNDVPIPASSAGFFAAAGAEKSKRESAGHKVKTRALQVISFASIGVIRDEEKQAHERKHAVANTKAQHITGLSVFCSDFDVLIQQGLGLIWKRGYCAIAWLFSRAVQPL